MLDFIRWDRHDPTKPYTAEFGTVTMRTRRFIEDMQGEDVGYLNTDESIRVAERHVPQHFSFVMYEFDQDIFIFAVPPIGLLIKLIYWFRWKWARTLFFFRDFGFIKGYKECDSILAYDWSWTWQPRKNLRNMRSRERQKAFQAGILTGRSINDTGSNL